MFGSPVLVFAVPVTFDSVILPQENMDCIAASERRRGGERMVM